MKNTDEVTVLDYFAGQAIQGLLAGSHLDGFVEGDSYDDEHKADVEDLVVMAFDIACVMEKHSKMLTDR